MAIEDNAQEKLMEQLRQGNKQVRSFDEIAQLLHVVNIGTKARCQMISDGKLCDCCISMVMINWYRYPGTSKLFVICRYPVSTGTAKGASTPISKYRFKKYY